MYNQNNNYQQYPQQQGGFNQPPQQQYQGGFNQPPQQYQQGGFNQPPQQQQGFNQPPGQYNQYQQYGPPPKNPKTVIQSLQYSIQYYKIDIGQLFNAYKSNFSAVMSYQDFSNLLLKIDPSLSPQDIQATFRYFDKDGDQTLSFQEFQTELDQMKAKGQQLVDGEQCLKKLKYSIDYYKIDVNQLFAKYDTSRNNRLDYHEFYSLIKRIDPNENDNNIRAAYTVLDHDQTGFISLQEFQYTLNQINNGNFSFQNQQKYYQQHPSQWPQQNQQQGFNQPQYQQYGQQGQQGFNQPQQYGQQGFNQQYR
ncbi:hypothetical protein PPERSA_09261 [Pseudocohnilembus persalinus]|uniref:EF-hand domain-containing protein n=1 Tax=Pseudocohnilembus persalinus TaxID=266149 RepID=A0A0V0QMF9_PSEPJ|nr:hypothetical protein PPERSA_09261 [Pseudocohnilembus persalinus]|eukprot:KRX03249.1 hypothetical protein PPERSA_09261 [Pseudocohnilembus persalinus]